MDCSVIVFLEFYLLFLYAVLMCVHYLKWSCSWYCFSFCVHL